MKTKIPSATEVFDELNKLKTRHVRDLSTLSGVPFTTLMKLRSGDTKDPGIETVRKFWSHLPMMFKVAGIK